MYGYLLEGASSKDVYTSPACSVLSYLILQEFLSKWGRPEGAETDEEEASQASGHALQPYVSTPSVLPELKEREGGAFQDSGPPQSYGGERSCHSGLAHLPAPQPPTLALLLDVEGHNGVSFPQSGSAESLGGRVAFSARDSAR